MVEHPKHRSKCRIFADLLRAIESNERARVTYLLHEANLSYDRLIAHLTQMERLGLIEKQENEGTCYYATKKGKKYLSEFKRVEEFGDMFGVSV